jgi:hypothetical protein
VLRGAPKRNTEGTPPRVLRVPPPVLNGTAANCGPRSGRRGRRFKSCHPDQHSRRPEPPPEERTAVFADRVFRYVRGDRRERRRIEEDGAGVGVPLRQIDWVD